MIKRLYLQNTTVTFSSSAHSGTIMTISKDRVKPSPLPDSWKLKEIFTTGVIIGTYLAIMTVIFYWAAAKTTFFNVSDLPLTCNGIKKPHALLCMQSKCGLNKFIFVFCIHIVASNSITV